MSTRDMTVGERQILDALKEHSPITGPNLQKVLGRRFTANLKRDLAFLQRVGQVMAETDEGEEWYSPVEPNLGDLMPDFRISRTVTA